MSCQEIPTSTNGAGEEEKDGSEKAMKSKKKMDMVRWAAAFYSYAIAADMAEV